MYELSSIEPDRRKDGIEPMELGASLLWMEPDATGREVWGESERERERGPSSSVSVSSLASLPSRPLKLCTALTGRDMRTKRCGRAAGSGWAGVLGKGQEHQQQEMARSVCFALQLRA